MTNEEKAKQIARGLAASDEYPHDYLSAYTAVMQAMEWKEQQLIDEACKWLAKNDSYAIPTNLQVDRLKEHLNNVK